MKSVIAFTLGILLVLLLGMAAPMFAGTVNVKFQVNMAIQLQQGTFRIGIDTVLVRGDFQGWTGNTVANRLTRNSTADSLYVITIPIDSASFPSIHYKFVIANGASFETWESINNRTYDLTSGPAQTIPAVYFNDQSIAYVRHVITFQADMTSLLTGGFNPVTDSMVVNGSFNGWSATRRMFRVGSTNVWQDTIPIFAIPGDSVFYKFKAFPSSKFVNNGWEVGMNRGFVFPTKDSTLALAVPNIQFILNQAMYFVGLGDAGPNSRTRVLDSSPVGPNSNPAAYQISGKSITVEAWVFPVALPPSTQNSIIIARPANGGILVPPYQTFGLMIIGNAPISHQPRLGIAISDGVSAIGSGNEVFVEDTGAVKLHQWTHVAGTYDGTNVKLYVNGILVRQLPLTVSMGTGSTGLYIGGMTYGYFKGVIDEVRLWNSVRAQADIQTAMNTTLGGTEPGLVGYWPLDTSTTINGRSPVTPDLTMNANHLFIQNAQVINTSASKAVQIAPTISATAILDAFQNIQFTFAPPVTGEPQPTITIVSGPSGMSVDAGQNVVWTPTSGQLGKQQFTLQATNSSGSAQATYQVYVHASTPARSVHQNDRLTMSVFNNGQLGTNDQQVPGLTLDGKEGLYSGGLAVVKSPQQVSRALYRKDFTMDGPIASVTPTLPGYDQAFAMSYTDGRAPNPIGVRVNQRSQSKVTDPDKKSVVVEYTVVNTSGQALNNIYLSMLMDFDVGAFNNDLGRYESLRKLAYVFENGGGTNSNYYGVCLLRGNFVNASIGVPTQLEMVDSVLYRSLLMGPANPSVPGDIRAYLTSGPYTIKAGDSATVAFAVLAGTSIIDLEQAVDQVQRNVFGPTPNLSSYFNGASNFFVNDTIKLNPNANPAAFQITGDTVTIEAWVYPTALPPYGKGIIAGKVYNYPATNYRGFTYALSVVNNGGNIFPMLEISTGNPMTTAYSQSPFSIPLFHWTHIAGTYDGHNLTLYVDGNFAGQAPWSFAMGGMLRGFVIGGGGTGGNYFQGFIDEVRVWRSVEPQWAIAANMTSVASGTEAGLAGYWPLDSIKTVNGVLATPDLTPNKNDLGVFGTTIVPFSHFSPSGAKLVLAQPSVGVGTVEYDRPFTLRIPISNAGTGPLVVTSNTGDVRFLSPSATDTIPNNFTPQADGPFSIRYFLSSNGGTPYGTVTGTGLIPHDYYDAGNIQSWLMPNGEIARNPYTGNAGLRFPRNSQSYSLFTSGLAIGANVNGAIRKAVAIYGSEFRPGNVPGGVPANPNDPKFHLYKIKRGDNANNNPDYAAWPSLLGAPTKPNGTPNLLGDETIWTVYNDFDSTANTTPLARTSPLGVEVRQTVWGYNQQDELGNTIFLRFDILNRGTNKWNGTYLSFFADPDLGYAYDDLVGIDPDRNMGFCYNGYDFDGVYGNQPPAIGFVMLDGPGGKPLSSAAYYINGNPLLLDPNNAPTLYNYQQGLRRDGSPFVDPTTQSPTVFPLNGNPVAGTGWLDYNPADRRILLNMGPATLNPGDSVSVAVAIIEAQGDNRFASLAKLKDASDVIRNFYRLVYKSGKQFGILAAKDIAADQGHQLRVQWSAHPLDVANDQHQIVRYEVYRKVDSTTSPGVAGKVISLKKTTGDMPVGNWELVGQTSASQTLLYSLVVPTLRDSNKVSGMYYTKFFVMARTSDPDFHFESPVDSGYSADNLPPANPSALVAASFGGKAKLNWHPDDDADLSKYVVYRATAPNADPKTLVALGSVRDTNFVDTSATLGQTYYYRVTAVDYSGNESGFSNEISLKITSVVSLSDVPTDYSLGQNYPNPFNPATTIRFGLPFRSQVKLEIYNALGQRIATVVDNELQPGYYERTWNAGVASGLYFYRIDAVATDNPNKQYVETKKMILLK